MNSMDSAASILNALDTCMWEYLLRLYVNYPTLLTRGWGLQSKNSSDLICYHKDMQ